MTVTLLFGGFAIEKKKRKKKTATSRHHSTETINKYAWTPYTLEAEERGLQIQDQPSYRTRPNLTK